MASTDATSVRTLVETYLPELDSDDIRDQLVRKIVALPDVPGFTSETESDFPPPPAYDPESDADGRLIDYFEHWVRLWTDGLASRVAASSEVASDNTIVADFVVHWVDATGAHMMRVLLEELYQRRGQNLLDGDTPADRYRSFRRWTNSPEGHRALLSGYPYLYVTARNRVRAAADYLIEILKAVEESRESLDQAMPGVREGSRIRSIATGKGDTHNGGRSVAQIEFDDGGLVLYKPRPVEAERGWHSFVAWLNERIGTRLPTITLLPCGPGGFSEFVSSGGFAGTTADYFRTIGQLTGALYLVKATDIHFENVLTCPEGPVVVDAEALLTPRWRSDQRGHDSAWQIGIRQVRESVAGIGVLPLVLRSPGTDRGVDVGVVSYDTGQHAPYRALQFNNPGRDDMSATLVAVHTSDPSGNPLARETAHVPAATQRDIIKRELRSVLEFAAANPEEVTRAVESRLADVQFRYMNNSTIFYSQLLRMTTHPHAVADARVRSALLHRVVLANGTLDDVAHEEVRQMSGGDVPYFSYTGRSLDLCAQDRTVRTKGFTESGMESVRSRITGLGQAEIEQQLRLVDLAFVSRLPLAEEPTGFTPRSSEADRDRPERARMLEEAKRIGNTQVESMIQGEDRSFPATWIAPQIATYEDMQWSPGVSAYDLYSGTAGVCLVLAGLGHRTGLEEYRDAALRVLEPVEEHLATGVFAETELSLGAMSGAAGTVYGLATAKRLLGIDAGMGPGELAQSLTTWLDSDQYPDLAGGAAGALAVGLSLWRHSPEGEHRALAADAVRQVAAAEKRLLAGTGGRPTEFIGYSHGSLGIAPPLLEYADEFDDEDARALSHELIEAVLSSYDEQEQDWPRTWDGDLRSYSWCHGAPGMLLGAMQIESRNPGLIPENQLTRMAELTLQRGFGNNPSYCHGDLGSTEIVLMAAEQRPDLFPAEVTHGLYERLFSSVIESYERRWDTKYSYSNALMLGQTGMAWSILRYLDPETYPSVLRLD